MIFGRPVLQQRRAAFWCMSIRAQTGLSANQHIREIRLLAATTCCKIPLPTVCVLLPCSNFASKSPPILKRYFWFSCLAILCPFVSSGQQSADVQALGQLLPERRWGTLLESDLRLLDSAAFVAAYAHLAGVAARERDGKSSWVLDFLRFKNRRTLKLGREQVFSLLADLEARAVGENWPVETLVAQHYTRFEQMDAKQTSHEQHYAYLLDEFARMQELGLERFRDYDISDLMYHSGEFMFDLEDHEKSLQFLLAGERFSVPLKTRHHTLVLTLNHIQSIYQQQNDYEKGIEYAKKILRFTDTLRSHKPVELEFCRFWQGLSTIDIASMLIQQRKFAEGETFADEGYRLMAFSRASNPESFLEGNFDVLMPLISIKLELNKIAEAKALIQQADDIWKKVGHREFNYFKAIRLWKAHARLAEISGDFAASVRYEHLAKPLQDSLDRRTDARKLEKIKQRMEARGYVEKIRLIEREKQTQTRLLYAALLGLLLVAAFAYWNYRRWRRKRQQAVAALEAAQKDLETYIQNFLEKSEQAENLRLEVTQFSAKGERSQNLQELLQRTILTEQDWAQFRALFEKVHPDFIQEQKTLYPEITQAELRYLVLEKLQLNTQEMAQMLGVSDGTIRQTRFRLRKKQL